ncbi:hypothetical protein [Nonomuraea gerenzanensis]|uniref:hypothetical protein n=1 Tax=Nonomuraea gerenzanensis TaxID=93944 RepID=UPI001CDA527C|nr:hypothetical protein [Nonomuraea gerenzanensis]UBU16627.1 hypothetical protein LCN96_16900 [Nonomuraea gerenzanensis]
MTNITQAPHPDDLVQLIATRAAEHWNYHAKSALTHLLADVLGDYDAAYQLVEETGRKLLAAEYEEDLPVTPPSTALPSGAEPLHHQPSYRGGPALDSMTEDEYRFGWFGQADYDGHLGGGA